MRALPIVAPILVGVTFAAACDGASPIRTTDSVAAAVRISVSELQLQVGESYQVHAEVLDEDGATITGETTTWHSGSPDVAFVGPQGLVVGIGPGVTWIKVESGDLADSLEITVMAARASDPLKAECSTADPAWIWCDDFEEDRLGAYFEHDDDEGEFVRGASVGLEGSVGMRVRFQADEVGAGSLKLAFGRSPDEYIDPADAGTEHYREIYWRLYVRHEPDWIGGGGDKLSRATILADASWAQAMIAHVWSGGSPDDRSRLVIDPASGTDEGGSLQTTEYNDFDNLRWLGSKIAPTPLFSADHVGQWYCVEAHVRLNDAGQENGTFRIWIDDALEAELLDLNWVGSYDQYGLNAVFLENYWNDGSAADQERYFDNFVVSTERIGCFGD
jgi:hypothetical protein